MKPRSLYHYVAIGAALLLGTITASLLSLRADGAEPALYERSPLINQLNQRVAPTVELQSTVEADYDLYVADPPKLQYVLEVRYTETSSQAGSDWFRFSAADSEEDLQDAIFWVALHLIAEWRVVPRWTEPEWMLFDTYDTLEEAEDDAAFFESFGLLTDIRARSILVPRNTSFRRP